MGMNVAQKLIEPHLMQGNMAPGTEIALKIDQTLWVANSYSRGYRDLSEGNWTVLVLC